MGRGIKKEMTDGQNSVDFNTDSRSLFQLSNEHITYYIQNIDYLQAIGKFENQVLVDITCPSPIEIYLPKPGEGIDPLLRRFRWSRCKVISHKIR